ncbi:MAG: sulfotransferase domain-containing protein [Acidimicrobiales bacterium]
MIGAMKAGTDSLWEYLRAHPQVFMSVPKELDFFVTELNWERGPEWYESHFRQLASVKVVGEASTSYSKWPFYKEVPRNIASLLPDARLVYLVRNPIERIRSQYLHQRLLGLERRPIDDAVLADPSYLNFSRYSMQLRQYLDYFDASHILVLVSEDLRYDRRVTMGRLAHFLGIDESWPEAALSESFHNTADKRVLRGPFALAHKLPGHDVLARRLPDVVKQKSFSLRARGIDTSQFILSHEIHSRLAEELHEEMDGLRTYLGGCFHCWGLI